jgi:hypothetical protein
VPDTGQEFAKGKPDPDTTDQPSVPIEFVVYLLE